MTGVENRSRKFQLTAAQLRWIALGAMLLDHLWAMVVPGNQWMTYAGRLVCLFLLNMVFFRGEYLTAEIFGCTLELQTQGFALLALYLVKSAA